MTSSSPSRHRPFAAHDLAPLLDAFVIATGLALAYVVAFDFGADERAGLYLRQWRAIVLPLVAVRVAAIALAGGYRVVSRFVGLGDAMRLAGASVAGAVVFLGVGLSLPWWGAAAEALGAPLDATGRPYRVPFRIHGIEAMIALLGCLGWRGLARLVAAEGRRSVVGGEEGEGEEEGAGVGAGAAGADGGARAAARWVVAGAGPEGRAFVRWLEEARGAEGRAVAFVDGARDLAGRRLLGVPVVAPGARLAEALRALEPTHVVVTGDAPPAPIVRHVLGALRDRHVTVLRAGAVAAGPSSLAPLRPDDLLRRDPVALAPSAATRDLVEGATIVVTGAGGSIGAAACRRFLELGAARVVAVGRGETSLHALRLDVEEASAPALAARLELHVADVRDVAAMRALLAAARPSLVLHAAAHKHVALMEHHPVEAWHNNVAATRALARLAREAGVARFVLVSSDKAVRPTSVMGATKRLAEWCVAAAAREEGATRFAAVRFGNVLGSRGSVVPIFQRQIARGGPLRVSDPKALRYFMTIDEAAALTIEAAALVGEEADDGAAPLYLLDMGEPVLIADLARALLTLAGRTEQDVPIVFTGLAPGEKLSEELVTRSCPAVATSRRGVLRAAIDVPEAGRLEALLEAMAEAAATRDDPAMRRAIFAAIPDATVPREAAASPDPAR